MVEVFREAGERLVGCFERIGVEQVKGRRQAARKEKEPALEICIVGWREDSGTADSTGAVDSQRLETGRSMYVGIIFSCDGMDICISANMKKKRLRSSSS